MTRDDKPENVIKPRRGINLLYTNIGRGHPFYLDALVEAFVKSGQIRAIKGQSDVFEVSTGLARRGWRTARWLYLKGSSRGMVSRVYDRVRSGSDYNRPSLMLSVMGRDIRKRYMSDPDPLVVAHPILVGILRGKKDLIYQHGEVVTPGEAVALGASKVIVPTEEAGGPFVERGYNKEDVFVSGLCIEPALVRQAGEAFEARIGRIDRRGGLTGAFFSSGAEPREHVEKLVTAAVSAVADGGRVIVFGKKGGRLAVTAAGRFDNAGVPYYAVDSADLIPKDFDGAMVVSFENRREENLFTGHLFGRFDYFVAPSHERTNWALGLGLPMFAVGPAVGPFAPLNRDKLVKSGVAEEIVDPAAAGRFGRRLHELRSTGALDSMARAGRGKAAIDGFERIVNFLVHNYFEKP